MQRLREAAEKAKIELSGVTTTNINLPYVTADQTGPKHLELTLSRAKFDDLTSDLVEKTMVPLKTAMKDAGLQPSDIKKILLVGGATRIPVSYTHLVGVPHDGGIGHEVEYLHPVPGQRGRLPHPLEHIRLGAIGREDPCLLYTSRCV